MTSDIALIQYQLCGYSQLLCCLKCPIIKHHIADVHSTLVLITVHSAEQHINTYIATLGFIIPMYGNSGQVVCMYTLYSTVIHQTLTLDIHSTRDSLLVLYYSIRVINLQQLYDLSVPVSRPRFSALVQCEVPPCPL